MHPWFILIYLIWQVGSRSYKRHSTYKNTEYIWQFIHRCLSQNAPYSRYTRIVFNLRQNIISRITLSNKLSIQSLSIYSTIVITCRKLRIHATKFHEIEWLTFSSNPLLKEENWTTRVDNNSYRDQQEKRRQKNNSNHRCRKIKESLPHTIPPI